MRCTFYIELLTHDKNPLSLLQLPTSVETSLIGKHSARWWAEGKLHTMTSPDKAQILGSLEATKINELDLRWRISRKTSETPRMQLVSYWLEFFPSPISNLWAPVQSTELADHSAERARLNFEAVQSIGTLPQGKYYPSTLGCTFHFDQVPEGTPESELQAQCLEWLLANIPREWKERELLGYGCVGGRCRTMLLVRKFSLDELESLNERFAKVCPILVGHRALCQRFVEAFWQESQLLQIANESPSAIVILNPEVVTKLSAGTMSNWFVEQDLNRNSNTKAIVLPPRP